MNAMYPESTTNRREFSLQSRLFGHRMKSNQTKYEYLIEFLQVAISEKEITKTLELNTSYFPINSEIKVNGLTYTPKTRIGLKRFIFFPKSKLEGKANVDREAYEACINMLKSHVDGGTDAEKGASILILQNLIYGFNAVNQNRSWFDQNVLPICEEVILPEGMGVKKDRQFLAFEQGQKAIDNKFIYNKYTYMRRGGEIYYLHLLNALNEFPEYKKVVEYQLFNLIHGFPQFTKLCSFIQYTWDEYMLVPSNEKETVKKALGAIPSAFSKRNKFTLSELKNFLTSKAHPFEKIEVFANGILLQMLRMMYVAAATESGSNCWVVDINCRNYDNNEMKKLAISSFKKNEEIICDYLYKGLDFYKSDLEETNEQKIIKDAAEDSYKLFRKLGKNIGIVIPNTGKGMRFSLSEDIIKFLVLSIIPPSGKVTLDNFAKMLYEHFGMVIGQDEYLIEMKKGCAEDVGDLSFLNTNKKAFAQKLKDCGFLRDLSDATSIVENPYESESEEL